MNTLNLPLDSNHGVKPIEQHYTAVECNVDYDMARIVIETDAAAQTGYF